MIYLVIDPGEKFIPKGEYQSFYPKHIPNVIGRSKRLHLALFSGSVRSVEKQIVIWNVHKLNARKSALLAGLLITKADNVNVILTTISERLVNDHLKNIPMKLRRLKGRKYKAVERSIFQRMNMSLSTRRIPDKEELFILFRSLGDTETLLPHNRKLIRKLDTALFRTNSDYIRYAWAGLHQNQRTRITVKSYKSEESTKPKKVKIDPVVKGTRKAKMRMKGKSRNRQDRLSKYF